jgi:hypothetical protein
MSFKTRIEKMAREQAELIANQLISQRMQQVQNSNTNFGQVTRVNSTELTIKLQDGTETKATAAGNRLIGVGDSGTFNAGLFQ